MMDSMLARLQNLIAIPSFSREESLTADLLHDELSQLGIPVSRIGNNILARNKNWVDGKPVLLLNSHHDTVRPVESYTRDPFSPTIESDRLFGLGSNDAGASLTCLMELFIRWYATSATPFNLLFIASAEEEISGAGGIALVLQEVEKPWGGIVGEPTLLKAAVAERGLMVIDGRASGIAGHAARQEGKNALYIACDDIQRIRQIRFDQKSKYLPDTQATVTQINGGVQHNIVPDTCDFVVDVRVNDRYSNQEVFDILDAGTESRLKARSFRLNSSCLPEDHPLFRTVDALGLEKYGSPTLSDQALMDFPTLKIGPGDSARSHTADEFIYLSELEEGLVMYHKILETLKNEIL